MRRSFCWRFPNRSLSEAAPVVAGRASLSLPSWSAQADHDEFAAGGFDAPRQCSIVMQSHRREDKNFTTEAGRSRRGVRMSRPANCAASLPGCIPALQLLRDLRASVVNASSRQLCASSSANWWCAGERRGRAAKPLASAAERPRSSQATWRSTSFLVSRKCSMLR